MFSEQTHQAAKSNVYRKILWKKLTGSVEQNRTIEKEGSETQFVFSGVNVLN